MSVHITVLLEETVQALAPRSGGIYVDGTLGGGGHTELLLQKSAPDGRVLSFDVNRKALEKARERFASYGDRWQGIERNFADLEEALLQEGIRQVDGILLDLGFSSDELLDPEIGLSFARPGVLDMRLGEAISDDGLTAAHVVNQWPEHDLEEVIRLYGEERWSRVIARAIVQARKREFITRTDALAQVIVEAVPASYEQGRIHPATRTFQALRILVNDELKNLRLAIEAAERVLVPGGRMAIITFHSLEDRFVKKAFQSSGWSVLTKKPLVPSTTEIEANPRSRSAKLRVAERALN